MKTKDFKSIFSSAVIPVAFVIAVCVYLYVMGDPSNFVGGNTNNHPLPGNFLGIIYKGGFIVPLLMTLLLVTITFSIERFITIGKAAGKGNLENFVVKVRNLLDKNN